jgi:hypothetical protein
MILDRTDHPCLRVGCHRLVLQNICGDIMEEVMDFGGDNFVIHTIKITKNILVRMGVRFLHKR